MEDGHRSVGTKDRERRTENGNRDYRSGKKGRSNVQRSVHSNRMKGGVAPLISAKLN